MRILALWLAGVASGLLRTSIEIGARKFGISQVAAQPAVDRSNKEELGDRAELIHIDVFDNLHLMRGGTANGVLSPTLAVRSLVSKPWTFVVDGEGLFAKFEAFTAHKGLKETLATVLP